MAILPFPKKDITADYGEMSAFRKARGMQAHSGTDFAPAGSSRGRTKIKSVGAGTIKLIQWSDILGWVIVQTVWDVKKNKAIYVGYSHISCNDHGMNCKGPKVHGDHAPVNKKVGSRVKEGQTMAYMGNTGSGSNVLSRVSSELPLPSLTWSSGLQLRKFPRQSSHLVSQL